jgi:N-acetylmuramoyl-L-alanine amidase
METVEETKLRLLREAVHDNLDTLAGIKRKFPAQRRRKQRVFLWLSAPLALSAVAYIGLPSHGSSNHSPVNPVQVSLTTTAPPSAEGVTDVPTAVPKPEPLSREILPLSIKTIVIDPGHGGRQTGAISDSGVAEKGITLDVALRLRRLMENGPFDVFLTRDTDQTMPLEKRVAFANSKSADLFVSIHVNWMEPRSIRGLETYFVGPTDDPAALNLARIENRESSYSFADYRHILEKIYVDARREESRRLAKSIQTELYQSLRQSDHDVSNRGIKMAPFVVLVGTQMPAILVELSSLSNDDEVKLLTNPDYREKIAHALLKGIRSYANNLNKTDRKAAN